MADRADDQPRPTDTAYHSYETIKLLAGMVLIFAFALLTGVEIDYVTAFNDDVETVLRGLQVAGVVVIVGTVVAAVLFGARHDHRRLLRTFIVYLVVATLQIVGNIAGLLDRAHVRDDNYLWGVWDVGACYLMIVAVFTGWYWVSDHLIPDGAFDFPQREGRPPRRPGLVDYVFIAFNTSSTFGPTSEAVMSRRVKVLMMFQTALSLVVLLVLVARVVGLQKG